MTIDEVFLDDGNLFCPHTDWDTVRRYNKWLQCGESPIYNSISASPKFESDIWMI